MLRNNEMPGKQAQGRNTFNRFAGDTGWSVASSFFLMLAGFLITVVLGTLLGEAGLGVYTLVATIYMFAGTVGMVGIPLSLTKYTAEFYEDQEKSTQYYGASLVIVFVATTAVGVLLFILRGVLGQLFDMAELAKLLPVVAVGVPFYGVNKIAMARMNGLRQMRTLAISESLRYIVMIVLTLIWNGWLRGGVSAAVWILTLTEVVLFPVIWVLTRLHRSVSLSFLSTRIRELGWVGSQLVLSRIIAELNTRLNVLLMGAFLTKAEIGMYSYALMLANSLSVLPTALLKVTGPAMTEMYARKQTESLERLTNQAMLISAFLLTLIAVPIIMFFSQITNLLYPTQPGFLGAETVFAILAAGQVFRGIALAVSPIFIAVNRPDVPMKMSIARLAANAGVTLSCMGPLRVIGAGLGDTAASFLDFVLRTVLIRPVVKIRVSYWPLLLIPVLGALSVLAASVISGPVPPWVARILMWVICGLVSMRLWRLDRYLVRLRSFITASVRPS